MMRTWVKAGWRVRARVRLLPMNPAPPVITTCMGPLSEGFDVRAGESAAAVQYVRGMGVDVGVVEGVVVGEDEDGVGRLQVFGCGLDSGESGERGAAGGKRVGQVWVDCVDVGTHVGEEGGDARGGGFAYVGGVGLVGEAEQQDAGSVDGLPAGVEAAGEAVDDAVGHAVVDLVREVDEADAAAGGAAGVPGEVGGVDGQAVSADAGTGCEGQEAEGFGGGGVDGRPDVDVQGVGEHRQFVDEGDVDVPEGVLQQLGQFGFLAAADGDDRLDEGAVEVLDGYGGGGVDAGGDFGGVLQGPLPVAWVDAFGGVADVEIGTGAQPRGGFEGRCEELFGRAGVGRGFQDDGRSRREMAAECSCRVLDVGWTLLVNSGVRVTSAFKIRLWS